MRNPPAPLNRRAALCRAIAVLALLGGARVAQSQQNVSGDAGPSRRWFDAAAAMKRLAESWGDQSYGAVLVLDDQLVGEGPSRVVKLGDLTAHAEREAIRDAQRRLKRTNLQGAVLYSTSRPCAACEAAAAAAGVSRMYFGERLYDAGVPTR
jgi:tRNA(adenine34) deaminase